ncbi:MAG TPA: hypothetical protein DHV65_08710 [Ktedonobacter sp.]|nr:hypothetical protein [Ktedonobacter sp.]
MALSEQLLSLFTQEHGRQGSAIHVFDPNKRHEASDRRATRGAGTPGAIDDTPHRVGDPQSALASRRADPPPEPTLLGLSTAIRKPAAVQDHGIVRQRVGLADRRPHRH